MLQRHVTSSPIPQNYINRCRQNGGIYWHHLSAQNSPKILGYITPYRAKRDVQCCNVTLRHHQSLKTIPIDAAKMAAYIGTIYPHKVAQNSPYWAILRHIGQQNGRSMLQRHVTSSPIPLNYTNRCRQNGGIYWHHLSAQNSPKILGYITPYRAKKGCSVLQSHVTSSPIPLNYTNRCRQNGGIYWHHLSAQNSPKILGYITPYRAKKGCSVLQSHVTSSPIPLNYTNRCRQNGGIYWHHLSAQNSPKILGYITPYRAKKGCSMLQSHVTSSPIPQNYTNRCRQNGGIYWHHLSAQNSPKILGYITPYRDVQCCNVTLRHHQSL